MKLDCWAKTFPRTEERSIRGFARSIDDRNPIHRNNMAAVKARLRGIVAPGVRVMGYVSAAIAEEIPGVIVREIRLKFKKPLYAGVSPVVFCAKTRERGLLVEVRFEVRDDKEMLAHGSCTLLLP